MKKENRDVLKAFTMIGQIGFSFITPIGLCSIIGYHIDGYFHTQYWFIILFFLGVLAAFRNIYHITRGFYEKDLKQEEKELEYWKKLNENNNSFKKKKKMH